ncbi:MAG: FHA domain-containing protein [Solirubrobacterales bacterium]
MIELVEIEPMPGRRVPIESSLTIGRLECDLTISSPQVSRHHATLAPIGGEAEIEDQGSRNGTFVNDQRVGGKQQLRAGDKLRIGETTWAVEGSGVAAPTEISSRGDVPAPASGIHESPISPGLAPTYAPPPGAAPTYAPPPAATPAPAPETVPLERPARAAAPMPAPAAAPDPAPAPTPAAGADAFVLGGSDAPRVSAARRVEATLICYAVVLLTAIAVAIYLITR